MFMSDRKAFMRELVNGVHAAKRAADRQGLKLCVRLNGATDIAWERLKTDDNTSISEFFVMSNSSTTPSPSIARLPMPAANCRRIII